MTPRMIDLHSDWILQYATETTLFDPELYAGTKERLPQSEGYLQTVSAAVLACFRKEEDWAARPDPWASLNDLIVRIEAEFSGRLLIGPEDVVRWRADREGLTWGVIGVEGFDALIRTEADLDRLPRLFERGVRIFQPVYGPSSVLGGSSSPKDARGLTELGRRFLDRLFDLSAPNGPKPAFDLAHLHPLAVGDALAWFEADPLRAERVVPIYSHGGIERPGRPSPRLVSVEHLKRLRAMGGVVGIGVSFPFYESLEQVRRSVEAAAEIPFRGEPGFAGLAIGTDFLGVDRVIPGLENAPEVVDWVRRTFGREDVRTLLLGTGRNLFERLASS